MASERQRQLYWSQIRIGLAVTLTILGVSILVFFIDEVKGAIENRYTLHFHTLTTQSLKPNAPVWLAGQRVGRVVALRFEPPTRDPTERLLVELSILESKQPFITEGAVAQIINAGLLGEAIVNILPAREPGEPLPEYAELTTAKELDPMQVAERMEGLIDSVAPVLERWQRVARQARDGDGTLARLARDRDRLAGWYTYVDELSALFDTVGSIAGSLSSLLEDPQTRMSLQEIRPRLKEVARRWEEGGGTIGSLARDSVLKGQLDQISGRIATIEERLRSGRGTAGRLLHDRALARELEQTRTMIRELREEMASSLIEGRPPR